MRRCLLFLLVLLFLPSTVNSHSPGPGDEINGPPGHDRPGPPPITTRVSIVVVVHPDMDDFGDAEVTLTIFVGHAGHGSIFTTVVEPDLDYDTDNGIWVISREIYAHRECSPMEPITITVGGIEADASNLDEFESSILDAVTNLVSLLDYRLDAALMARIVSGLLAALNPDDSLGSGSATVSGPDVAQVTTTGGDYSILATFNVSTTPESGSDCDPEGPPPPDDDPPWCFQSRAFFDSLIADYGLVDHLAVEPGNPGNVTPANLAAAGESLRSLTRGLARWASVRMVEKAQGLAGFGPAYLQYKNGHLDPTVNAISGYYRPAFCAAELALLNNVPGPGEPPMLREAMAVPTHAAVRSGRSVEYLLGVFGPGAAGVPPPIVQGLPPGATWQILPAEPIHHPSWRILRVTTTSPPGVYPFQVLYTDPQLQPVALILDIDQAPTSGLPENGPAERPGPRVNLFVWPQPMSASATIWLDLAEPVRASLTLHDVTGRRILDITPERAFSAGRHRVPFDGGALASGVYYLRLEGQEPDEGLRPVSASHRILIAR